MGRLSAGERTITLIGGQDFVETHREDDFDRPNDGGNDKCGPAWCLHADATGA